MGKWLKRWREGVDHWEDRRVKRETPEEVLAGLASGGRRIKPLLSKSDQQGRSVDLVPAAAVTPGTPTTPAILAEEVTVLNISGDDRAARVVTVHLVATPNSPLLAGGPQAYGRVRGTIEWGTAGVSMQARVDWLMGTSFTVGCSFLRVSADAFEETLITELIRVGATANYGTVATAGARLPQLTVSTIAVAAGALSPLIPIPVFAHNVMVNRTQPAAVPFPSMNVEYINAVTSVLYAESFALGVRMESPTRLGNEVRQIRIRNNDALPVVYTLIFELAL